MYVNGNTLINCCCLKYSQLSQNGYPPPSPPLTANKRPANPNYKQKYAQKIRTALCRGRIQIILLKTF